MTFYLTLNDLDLKQTF